MSFEVVWTVIFLETRRHWIASQLHHLLFVFRVLGTTVKSNGVVLKSIQSNHKMEALGEKLHPKLC